MTNEHGYDVDTPVGVKNDAEKAPWDLLPWRALSAVVGVLEHGRRKYSAWNWVGVPRARERYFAALQRHMTAWWGGETLDPDSHLRHLAHAGCCVLFLLALELGDTGPRGPT